MQIDRESELLLRAPIIVGIVLKTSLGHSVKIKKLLQENPEVYVVTYRVSSDMQWLTREKPERRNNDAI